MPTSIAKKAIRATQFIGMVGQASPFAENHSTRKWLSIVRDLLE
jgi:hypothetical protein